MNTSMIRYIIGIMLKVEGVLLTIPSVVSLIYREIQGIFYVGTGIFCVMLGFILTAVKPRDTVFYLKEGCIATALSWIFLILFGALPPFISGEIPSFTDSFFEIASGFTTTGASILSNVEVLSHTLNFWRCFTHWIGGMGILVFMLAIVPLSGGGGMNLMRAESPGPSVGKLVPRLKQTAGILYSIYIGLTIIMIILLLVGKMPVFDTICTALGTAGTGGFAIKNDSFSSYTLYQQWITTIFMILFGVNFNLYYFIILKQFKKAVKMEEVRWYFIIILVSVSIITFNILDSVSGFGEAVSKAAFQVGSVITTTGFASADFDLWPTTSKCVLVLLMFVGACAGSTGGGIKVSRFVIMVKSIRKELQSYLHPKLIKKVKMDEHPIEHEVVRSTNVYLITYLIIFGISLLLISLENRDFTTTFTSVAATYNNIGPGLADVGPTCNFGSFSNFSKWVFIFNMIAGRLELFPVLLLIYPSIWKELFARKSALRNRRKNKQ